MATVEELKPGQRVVQGGMSAIFVAQTNHPLYAALRLVVWKLDSGQWSHDALSAFQYVGEVVPGDDLEANLRKALQPEAVTS